MAAAAEDEVAVATLVTGEAAADEPDERLLAVTCLHDQSYIEFSRILRMHSVRELQDIHLASKTAPLDMVVALKPRRARLAKAILENIFFCI